MSKAKRDDPRCDCLPGFIHRVSNQPDEYDKDRAFRSVWVCDRRDCTLDAMAWVERGTGEIAVVRPNSTHDCDMCERQAVAS